MLLETLRKSGSHLQVRDRILEGRDRVLVIEDRDLVSLGLLWFGKIEVELIDTLDKLTSAILETIRVTSVGRSFILFTKCGE
jgi:hypothetical protein